MARHPEAATLAPQVTDSATGSLLLDNSVTSFAYVLAPTTSRMSGKPFAYFPSTALATVSMALAMLTTAVGVVGAAIVPASMNPLMSGALA